MINFNMGCIETRACRCRLSGRTTINFNMGCIETRPAIHLCICQGD